MGFRTRVVLCGLLAAAALVCAGAATSAYAQVQQNILWTFSGSSDGAAPEGGGLIADERGALYGTTQFGGAVNAPTCIGGGHGCGVVFKLIGTGFATEDDD